MLKKMDLCPTNLLRNLHLFCIIILVTGWQEEHFGVNVKVEDTSARITVTNGVNTMLVSFHKIVEVDQHGLPVGLDTQLKHTFNNFENTQFTPSPSTEMFEVAGEDRNLTVIRRNFTAQLDGPAAQLSLSITIYDNTTIVPNADSGESYEIYNGTVKFAFTLSSWPFCGIKGNKCAKKNGVKEIGKYLDVQMLVQGKRKQPVRFFYDKSRVISGDRPTTWDYGGGDVTFSHKYYLNETWYTMPTGYPILKADNESIAIMRFPLFYTEVFYDPTINVTSTPYVPSSSNHLSQSTKLFTVSAILCFFAVHLL